MTRTFAKLLVVGLIVPMLLAPITALACGPFSLDTIFSFTVHPEYPLENFARGNIGIVQPSYARSFLFVAYRHLDGNSFSPTEQTALVDLWSDRLNMHWEPLEEPSVKRWQDARAKVVGVGEPPKIDVYRSREKPNDYENYLNCQKDSFETAADTLGTRTRQWGAGNAALRVWVEGQDQVFANCSEGKHIPAGLPADADAAQRADRQYQIAAAHFYAGDFAEALAGFREIASDRSSPWSSSAPYLIARTFLRQASLGSEDQKAESLTEAEKQLQTILNNEELKTSHENAQRLLNLVRLRLRPRDTLHDLALSLAEKKANPDLKQQLWDYTDLMDQFIGDEPASAKTTAADLGGDSLTDWILTFKSETPESYSHALERWKTTSSVPWLIAALAKVDSGDSSADTLKRAAAAIGTDSPAFPSAAFHVARLDIAAGRFNEARSMLDELLGKRRSTLNASALNSLRHQRMLVAHTLDEFLNYAQRVPAALSWNDDGREIPQDPSEGEEEMKALRGKPLFDADAAKILNEKMPLSVLKQAAMSKVLPDHLRRDVVQAAWLRAVILGDQTTAIELAPALKSLVPEMASFLDSFVAARGLEPRRFAGIYAWLKFPGLEPSVDSGIGRSIPLSERDSYRDNWWCTAAFASSTAASEASEKKRGSEIMSPLFLTNAQRANAGKEHAMLPMGAAPNYISQQVLKWAASSPNDARLPEALHLAVASTRYGCSDKQTGRWSKAAYDFLHRRYPRSVWAKQTPYWFKE